MTIEPVWPSPELEAEMISDYDTDTNAGCHIRALLCRVRELEKELRFMRSTLSSIRDICNSQLKT